MLHLAFVSISVMNWQARSHTLFVTFWRTFRYPFVTLFRNGSAKLQNIFKPPNFISNFYFRDASPKHLKTKLFKELTLAVFVRGCKDKHLLQSTKFKTEYFYSLSVFHITLRTSLPTLFQKRSAKVNTFYSLPNNFCIFLSIIEGNLSTVVVIVYQYITIKNHNYYSQMWIATAYQAVPACA